ncbi:MAG TPA: serine/threonine-protein kinase [Gemmatimonadales bacterium]|nr:serine/threonine-protein kinase [Gemmatimonadales bacterium]
MTVDTPTVPAELAGALSSRYNLRSMLGRGGMATVYLADDQKHHRQVAVKVLTPDLAASVGADRFLTEIRIVAQLTHPHILALHDSGEAGGFIYYVMPYIGGGSLRQRLERDGPMELATALTIATPVADALSYAHRMGVLHRDIKPENILFSQGHPIVADFGIARAVSAATGPHLTRTGLALGTPGYMSPEQSAAVGEFDERTDVYGLAAVIYEMLVGEVPRFWPTEEEVRVGRFIEAPSAHRGKLARAGTVAESALVRALAVRPSQRTVNPDALIAELSGKQRPRRVYHADEVDAIVRKAAELEVTNPTSGAMTIGGVEALAAEVGIKPELVRSAAGALSPRSTPGGAGFVALKPPRDSVIAGGPTRLHYERIIDGELLDADFPVVLDEIRRAMGSAGTVSQLGRSFTWTVTRTDTSRLLEITVTVRGGRTRLTIQENLGRLMGAIYGGIGGGVGGGGFGLVAGIVGGALGATYLLPILLPAWILAVYGGARMTYRYSSFKKRNEAEGLADHLASVIRDLISGS